MAEVIPGLLSWIDRQKQAAKANVGLLLDNPSEYFRQIEESARDINRNDRLAVQGKNAELAGRQATPEQLAAMQALDRRAENLATGFAGSIKPRGLLETPFDKAHKVAQENAVKMLGLPPNNTAMDRARALGALDAYHGTNADIKQIDKSLLGSSTGAQSAKQAFWAVDNPEVARGYAEYAATYAPVQRLMQEAAAAEKIAQRTGNWDKYDALVRQAEELEQAFYNQPLNGQNIMPLKVIPRKPVSMDAKGESFAGAETDINSFLRRSKVNGADVAIIKNLDDAAGRVDLPATHYGILNPAAIRSRFAAFDPARINEPDLLAAGIPLGLIAGTEVEVPKKAKKK